jgi:hypothetical protein
MAAATVRSSARSICSSYSAGVLDLACLLAFGADPHGDTIKFYLLATPALDGLSNRTSASSPGSMRAGTRSRCPMT